MAKKSARTVSQLTNIDDSKIKPPEYQPEDATGYSAPTSSNT
jgi:hypothetical protein